MAPQQVARLVGRARDVAALVAAADQARAGDPRGVVVTGEAGIGKTRLVSEVVAALDDALVLTGHAVNMSTGEIPFAVLAETLRDLRHRVGREALSPAERAALGPLLPGGAGSGTVEPARILSAALDLLTRLCADRLLVWVVEDLHWADSGTRDLVNLALRTVRGHLLVIVTVRTDDPLPASAAQVENEEQVVALARLANVRRLDLARLTDDEVHTVIRLLADDLPPAAMRSITRLSDGVPFAVVELTAARGSRGARTVSAALAARVARLGPDARRVVEAAAIGDGHLRISLVEQVAGPVVEAVDAALAEAVASGLLVRDHGRDRLEFRHALLREAVDAEIGPGARRDWHRRWADALEVRRGTLADDPAAIAVAEHRHRAGDVARSVSAAFAALPAVERTGDLDLRLELWRRILEGWDRRDPSTAVGQLTRREALGVALRRPITSDDALLGFLRTAERQPLRPPERLLVEAFRPLLGTPKTGLREHDLVRRAATEVDWLSEPPDALTRTALVALGHLLPPEDDERADLFLDRAEELTEDDLQLRLDVAKARADRCTRTGDVAGAVRVLERAWKLIGPDDVDRRLAFSGDLAWNHTLMGHHRAADALVTAQLENTPRPETRAELWEHVVENAVYTWTCTGAWARARRTFERAAVWWPDDVRMSNLWVAHLDLLEHGVTDEERWREHAGLPISGGPDASDLRHLLARAAGLRGDLGAMRDLSAGIWIDPRSVGDVVPAAVVNLSRLEADAVVEHPDRSDREAGAEHLQRMAEALDSRSRALAHDEAARLELAAQTARFHGRDARAALEAALEAWARMDHLPDAGVTHLSLAEAHARAGSRDIAREHLEEGRRIAVELGARPWLARAAAIAQRYGFTTRAQRPEDVLTAREAEVLTLLAEGRTNRQIAETLFISAKTASVHVSRVITKMGASNRTEAVGIARRRGLVDTDER